jgi:hypothetical protein
LDRNAGTATATRYAKRASELLKPTKLKEQHDRQIEGTMNMKVIRMQVFGAVLFVDIS